MGTKELCKRGIATHVIVDGRELTAKEYLKQLKKKKAMKKQTLKAKVLKNNKKKSK